MASVTTRIRCSPEPCSRPAPGRRPPPLSPLPRPANAASPPCGSRRDPSPCAPGRPGSRTTHTAARSTSSFAVTSDWAMDEWLSLFDDSMLDNSALDRLSNARGQIVIEGGSYRERLLPRRALLGARPCHSLLRERGLRTGAACLAGFRIGWSNGQVTGADCWRSNHLIWSPARVCRPGDRGF